MIMLNRTPCFTWLYEHYAKHVYIRHLINVSISEAVFSFVLCVCVGGAGVNGEEGCVVD